MLSDSHAMDSAVHMVNASFDWQPASLQRDASMAALHGLSLHVPTGHMVAITGDMGSGKSSLLLGLLGELVQVDGYVMLRGRVAYVPQQPWIITGTVRYVWRDVVLHLLHSTLVVMCHG